MNNSITSPILVLITNSLYLVFPLQRKTYAVTTASEYGLSSHKLMLEFNHYCEGLQWWNLCLQSRSVYGSKV